jgi:hypothetical protein
MFDGDVDPARVDFIRRLMLPAGGVKVRYFTCVTAEADRWAFESVLPSRRRVARNARRQIDTLHLPSRQGGRARAIPPQSAGLVPSVFQLHQIPRLHRSRRRLDEGLAIGAVPSAGQAYDVTAHEELMEQRDSDPV